MKRQCSLSVELHEDSLQKGKSLRPLVVKLTDHNLNIAIIAGKLVNNKSPTIFTVDITL